MAIAFRTASSNGANNSDIVISKSALTGLADGDVIVFAMSQYNTGTDTWTSSDATVVDSLGTTVGADLVSAYAYYVVISAAYWIGQCDARGVELILPESTALLRNKIYMYEGGAMIYRQDLEQLRVTRERQKKDAFARLANLEGQFWWYREPCKSANTC